MWKSKGYICLKPLNSFVTDMIFRMEHMEDWLRNGPPKSFWVSAFFFPQGFMTASMQMHSRRTQIAIDNLKFECRVTQHETTDPLMKDSDIQKNDVGVNMHGVYMQGAGWDLAGCQIKESNAGELFVLMPVILLYPLVLKDFAAAQKAKPKVDYDCPMYKTSERRGTLSTTGHSTNFVMYIQLAYADKDPAHWTRRGTALLCMLDD